MTVRHSFVVVVFLALGLARGQQPYSHPPDAAPPGSGVEAVPTPSADQIRDLIRRAADRDLENDKRQRDYTYVEREQENRLGGKGQVASSESKTHDVMELYGEQVERLIAKDDKPLSSKDAAKEEERIQKLIDERKNESEDDRRKRLEKEEKDREQAREFVKEITDAYNFRFAGMERVEGREVYVIDADPRPGYEPRRREAKLLPKFRFRVWIDKADEEWVKLDAQCIVTVSVGWFIARVHKGSRVLIEQTRVNDEVWLPKREYLSGSGRIGLVKRVAEDQEITWSDYKKFRVDSKVITGGQ